MRANAVTVDRWTVAVDALESLMAAGIVAEALAIGWDARELVGVNRRPPHDAPGSAGLIFSMRRGDGVQGPNPSPVPDRGRVRPPHLAPDGHCWLCVPALEARP
jgi:hypothetical protein